MRFCEYHLLILFLKGSRMSFMYNRKYITSFDKRIVNQKGVEPWLCVVFNERENQMLWGKMNIHKEMNINTRIDKLYSLILHYYPINHRHYALILVY